MTPKIPKKVLFSFCSQYSYVNYGLPSQMIYFTQFTVGQIYFFDRAYDEALPLFESAIVSAENIDSEAIHNSLTNLYLFKGAIYHTDEEGYEQAIRDYTRSIDLDPVYASAFKNRGLVYRDIGNLELAIIDFEQYLKLDPNASDREEIMDNIEQLKAELGQ